MILEQQTIRRIATAYDAQFKARFRSGPRCIDCGQACGLRDMWCPACLATRGLKPAPALQPATSDEG